MFSPIEAQLSGIWQLNTPECLKISWSTRLLQIRDHALTGIRYIIKQILFDATVLYRRLSRGISMYVKTNQASLPAKILGGMRTHGIFLELREPLASVATQIDRGYNKEAMFIQNRPMKILRSLSLGVGLTEDNYRIALIRPDVIVGDQGKNG